MIRAKRYGLAAGALGVAALLAFAAAAAPRLLGQGADPAGTAVASIDLRPAPKHDAARLPIVAGPRGRPLVVIDPGHGGHDPGAISPFGPRESEITLAIARAIREALLLSGRVRVALTRDDDRFLLLRERFGIAERLGATLFISVHADSAPDPKAAGATVYTLSEVASDREAARLAQRENRADLVGGRDFRAEDDQVTSILIDLALRDTMDRSSQFAALLRREAAPLAPFRQEAHRFASLLVLKSPDVPSALLEAGYLSNEADSARLLSPSGQERLATGVARAVETHIARERGGAPVAALR